MKRSRGVVAAVACALALAGLTIVSASASTQRRAGAASYDPNGVLRRPIDMSANGGISFDPATLGAGEYSYTYPVLASFLKTNPDGTFSPDLAQKVTSPDQQTIVINLRPGLQFSNGEKLDSQAAVNSIMRAKAATAAGLRAAEMNLLDNATIESPTQFTLHLKTPSIGAYYALLDDPETAPVAPASIAQNTKTSKTVIAAGPMKIDSYTPGVGVKMSKNDKYWDAKHVKLGGYELVNVAAGPGNIVTALRGGTVNFAQAVPFGETSGVAKPIVVLKHQQNAPYLINMCVKDGTPLGNLQVRQALNYATDRNDINKKLYNGASSAAWTLFPSNDPYGNKALDDIYKYNPTKAKQLLAQAGYPNGLELTAITAPSGDAALIDQVVQAQWAKVGVKLNLKVSNNTTQDWYLNPTGQTNTVPMIREGVGRLTRIVTTNSFANVCHFPVPTIDGLATQISAVDPHDPQAAKLWKLTDTEWTKNLAFGVPTVFVIQSLAYNSDQLGGMKYIVDGILQLEPDVTKVYVKKG